MGNISFNFFEKTGNKMRQFGRTVTRYKLLSRMYAQKYHKVKISEDAILYETRDGQNISDSPLSVLKYLLKNEEYNGFKHYIVFQRAYEEAVILGLELQGIDINDDRVILLRRNTPEYIDLMLRAKYLLTDSTFQNFFVKKPEQIYINTWHGTPLKYMGYAMPNGVIGSWNVMRNFFMSDYLVSPNEHTTNVYLNDYMLNGSYTGKITQFGYPRNDVFFGDNQNELLKQYLIDNYHIDGSKKILVFAPTWTEKQTKGNTLDIVTEYLNQYNVLNNELGNEYNILLKVHPFVFKRIRHISELRSIVVNDAIDANDLLALTDILLTDYSSIFFDYLITDKPVIFYDTTDEYADNRGYYFDLETLPGPHFDQLQDVVEFIKKADYSDFIANYTDFKKRFIANDHGDATEKLIKLFINNSYSTSNLVEATHNKKKALIYTGGLQANGISEALINLVNSIDPNKYDISLLTAYSGNNVNYQKNFNRFNRNIRTFVIRGESSYGWWNLARKSFAEKHGYNKLIRSIYPEKAASLNSRRLLGNQSFDIAIDFDSYVMDNGQWIASSQSAKTYNILHNDMWLEAEKTINGKLKNPKTKRYVPFWSLFDTALSVSYATQNINDIKLKKYINSSGVLTNIIDGDSIKLKASQHIEYKNLNISNMIEDVDMTNSSQITQATFSEINQDIRKKSITTQGNTKPRIFITNSRLSPEKNLDNLILAFVKLHETHSDIELQIFGNDVGHYASVLYNLVVQNNATDYIKFFGYSNNPYPAVQSADVFLLPSHTEGQSIALMEAMVLKKDIIASNVAANVELLKNGEFGLLTEGNDIQALYAALKLVADGRYKKLKNFDYKEHNELVLKQFDNLFTK